MFYKNNAEKNGMLKFGNKHIAIIFDSSSKLEVMNRDTATVSYILFFKNFQ